MKVTMLATLRWPALLALLALTHGSGGGAIAGQRLLPHRPIPMALLLEHAELDASLRTAAAESGALGDTARAVLALVRPHMAREQDLALAPLRLLPRLAAGEADGDMAEMIAVTDRLRAELPALRREHLAIKRKLEELWTVAWAAGKPEYAFLAQRVNRHIDVDEEVLYPASLLVGEYLRLALARTEPRLTRLGAEQ